jgi:hypothetical protein
VTSYRRAPDPDMRRAFESQADQMSAIMAGPEVAADVQELLRETAPSLLVAGCMLPAALAAAAAAGTPAVSVVHFLYGPARATMVRGGGWTTDVRRLDATRRGLGR